MSRRIRSKIDRARFVFIIFACSLAIPFTVFAEGITVKQAVKSALARSSSLRQSELRITSSLVRETDILESTLPSFSFVSDPTYGLVTQRIAGVAPPLVPVALEPSTLIINSTSAGVSLTQQLPTGGVVSGSLRGGFTVSADRPEAGDISRSFTFEPSFSLSVSQPLFVDGKFIDTERPALVYEQAQRATRELTISGDLIMRRIKAAVIALYTQLGTLRRAAALQDSQKNLLGDQLERSRIRNATGQSARQEQFELQVQINRLDGVRLQTSLAINELEFELTNLTDLPFGSETELEPVAELNTRAEQSLGDAIDVVTIEQRASYEALRRAETGLQLARKQTKATANAVFSVTPRYADDRQREGELWGSIADYSGEGAGVDIALSIGLKVPLGEAAALAREIRQAEIAVELAREDVQNAAEDAENRRRLFALRIDNLLDRIELLKYELEFEGRNLEYELELVELGVSSDSEVDAIRVEILTAEIDLEDLAAQLFLARMDLAALRGLDLAAVVAGAD